MSLTKADIDQIIGQLKDAPPPSDNEHVLSKKEVIQKMRPVIKKLKSKGYTTQQIHGILEMNGIEISMRQVDISVKKKRNTKKAEKRQIKSRKSSAPEPSQIKDKNEKQDQKTDKKQGRLQKTEGSVDHDSTEDQKGGSYFTPEPDKEDI